jgi:DNA mismatch repair protein MSH5
MKLQVIKDDFSDFLGVLILRVVFRCVQHWHVLSENKYLTLLQIGCAGAVLSYLARRRTTEYLPGDQEALLAFNVNTIEMFSLADLMFINTDTLNSLQILQSEFHPNTHMQGPTKSNSGVKESLSVYGLFRQLAHTPQGKHKLRQVFLRPSLDLDLIQERHNTIAILLRPGNAEALNIITQSLKRIKNIRTVLIHLTKGVSAPTSKGGAIKQGIWGSLQQFTFHSLKVVDAIRSIEDGDTLAIVGKVNTPFYIQVRSHMLTVPLGSERIAASRATCGW